MSPQRLNGQWKLLKRIGKGSFGKVYLAEGKFGEKVAVKIEDLKVSRPVLKNEYLTYRKLEGCQGFSKVHYFGQVGQHDVMVMDLLGPSLKDLFKQCNHSFSLKTTLQLADQMLERMESMHSKFILHCDIKPANFVLGLEKHANTIYCIDFGLSRPYYDRTTGKHVPFNADRSFIGTPRYASISTHLGITKSRRDDLESIGYLLIYFLKGGLPWQGIKGDDKKKNREEILKVKQQMSLQTLCQDIPEEFTEYLKYTRTLKFDEKPNITFLRNLFRELYISSNCADIPQRWDWDAIITTPDSSSSLPSSDLSRQRQKGTIRSRK